MAAESKREKDILSLRDEMDREWSKKLETKEKELRSLLSADHDAEKLVRSIV